MGRKVHPVGMRLGVNETWQGRWFAEGAQYRQQLHQDLAVRSLLTGVTSKGGAAYTENVRKLRSEMPEAVLKNRAGVSRVEIERLTGKIRIAIFTAKPGVLIGRKGESVKKIRAALETLIGKKSRLGY
jgi:small subunit ribosomal protein S3